MKDGDRVRIRRNCCYSDVDREARGNIITVLPACGEWYRYLVQWDDDFVDRMAPWLDYELELAAS